MNTMPLLSLIGSIAAGSVLGIAWMDERHVAEERYSRDMEGLIQQQQTSERWQLKRDMRSIYSGAEDEQRELTPMEKDDIREMEDRLDEIAPR